MTRIRIAAIADDLNLDMEEALSLVSDHGGQLNCYASSLDDGADDITVDEAVEIIKEAPGMVYTTDADTTQITVSIDATYVEDYDDCFDAALDMAADWGDICCDTAEPRWADSERSAVLLTVSIADARDIVPSGLFSVVL